MLYFMFKVIKRGIDIITVIHEILKYVNIVVYHSFVIKIPKRPDTILSVAFITFYNLIKRPLFQC